MKLKKLNVLATGILCLPLLVSAAVFQPEMPEPGEPGEPGGGGMVISSAMDLDAFQRLAFQTDTSGRCMDIGIGPNECRAELDYALNHGLITRRAYDWALANGYYPVINRHGQINAICKCGCFEGETQISVRLNGKELTIAAKDVTRQHQLKALSADATLSALHQEFLPVQTLTAGPEKPELYQFALSNGRKLTVTQHHGMVLSDGRVVAAKDVTADQRFLSANGEVVDIDRIARLPASGEVVNFETSGQDDLNHIIVAEGVLVGDLIWQNQRSADLGRIVLRQ